MHRVSQPAPLSGTELGALSDAEPASMHVAKPALLDDELGFLSQPEPGLLPNADVQSIANPLLDMVEDAANEPEVQYLPSEILSRIIEFSLKQDMSMLGTFNQFSLLLRELSAPFYPNLHIREALAERELDKEDDCSIPVL